MNERVKLIRRVERDPISRKRENRRADRIEERRGGISRQGNAQIFVGVPEGETSGGSLSDNLPSERDMVVSGVAVSELFFSEDDRSEKKKKKRREKKNPPNRRANARGSLVRVLFRTGRRHKRHANR